MPTSVQPKRQPQKHHHIFGGWRDMAMVMLSEQPVIAHAIIIRIKGSAPQIVGADMVIGATAIWNTIGGGALEHQIMMTARKQIANLQKHPQYWHRQVLDIALGPDMGQCCGGHVKILLEYIGHAELDDLKDMAKQGNAVSHPLVSGAPPSSITLADSHLPRLEADAFMAPQTGYRRPLFIYGAGHVGRALIHVTAPMGFDIHWVDFAEDRFPQTSVQDVDFSFGYRKIIAIDPAKLAGYAPEDAFHIILTHSHQLDEAICYAVLSGGGFARCGLIGSQTKKARFEHRLKKRGISDQMLARLTCPIGLDLIVSKAPAHLAISIAAQLAIWQEQGNNA